MSDSSQGPDWWQASDGKWYPPPRPDWPTPAPTDTTEALAESPAPDAAPPPIAPPPMAPPMAPPTATMPQAGGPDPFGTPEKNKTPLIIGGIIAAVVVAVIAVLLLGGGDDEEALDTDETEQADDDPSGEDEEPGSEADEGPGPDPEPSPDDPFSDFVDADDAEALEVADQGFIVIPDEFSDGEFNVSYGYVVENPNGDDLVASTVEINIGFFDESGTAIETRSDFVSGLLPGQRVGSGGVVTDVPEGIVRMEVDAEASQFIRVTDLDGELTVGDVEVVEEEFGGHTASFDVSSSFSERQDDITLYGLFLDGGGNIIGGSQAFLEFVEPGGSSSAEINSFLTIPDLAEVEVSVSLSPTTLFSS